MPPNDTSSKMEFCSGGELKESMALLSWLQCKCAAGGVVDPKKHRTELKIAALIPEKASAKDPDQPET